MSIVAPNVQIGDGVSFGLVTWPAVGNGSQGGLHPQLLWRQVFVQVTGTFGTGGSVKLEGSNDGVNWVGLSPTALAAAGFFGALGNGEHPKYIRPNVTAGDGTTALTVSAWFSG